MTGVILFCLACIGVGLAAGLVALLAGGMFRVGTRADENTDYGQAE